MKILLSEAENWVKAGRSKIYADARKGVLSTEKDPHRGNKKVVDTSELQRVYGEIQNPDENPQRTETNGDGRYISTDELIKSYENRILDLEQQLARATDRETALMDEKSKLLDLLSAEKEEKRLMLPPPKTSFFDIFRRR
jgi:hypothetical protein